jgi:hypothetical protein
MLLLAGVGRASMRGMPWTIPNLLLHDKPVRLANMREPRANACLRLLQQSGLFS